MGPRGAALVVWLRSPRGCLTRYDGGGGELAEVGSTTRAAVQREDGEPTEPGPVWAVLSLHFGGLRMMLWCSPVLTFLGHGWVTVVCGREHGAGPGAASALQSFRDAVFHCL